MTCPSAFRDRPPLAPRHRGPARCGFCGRAVRDGAAAAGGDPAIAAPARATAAAGPRAAARHGAAGRDGTRATA